MKIILTVFCAAMLIAVVAGGCRGNAVPTVALEKKPAGRVLIAFYSESKNKNTKTVAEWIQQQTGGDLFEITMVKPYPEGYRAVLKEAKRDLDGGIKPEIKPFEGKIADYDIVFVGSPVWYGTFAPPVGTFLAGVDLSGKTVIPFCTHGGGGAGTLFADLVKACPKATVAAGLAVKGSNVVERTTGRGTREKVSPNEVVEWLNRVL